MSEVIKIAVKPGTPVSYLKLVNLQGDLKILTEQQYQKFRANILKNGFIDPIGVWIDPDDGKFKILNGHQRLATVKRMVEKEGFQIGDLPINVVEADNIQDAKIKLLALTSEYGEMTQDGLVNFLADMNMKTADLQDYLENAASLQRVQIEQVMANLGELKTSIEMPDPLDVGNIIVGGDPVPPSPLPDKESAPAKATKNDPMTGLRLVQVFLTDAQLSEFKARTDAIQKHYKLENLTATIMKCVEVVAQEVSNARDKVIVKKSKR